MTTPFHYGTTHELPYGYLASLSEERLVQIIPETFRPYWRGRLDAMFNDWRFPISYDDCFNIRTGKVELL